MMREYGEYEEVARRLFRNAAEVEQALKETSGQDDGRQAGVRWLYNQAHKCLDQTRIWQGLGRTEEAIEAFLNAALFIHRAYDMLTGVVSLAFYQECRRTNDWQNWEHM